MFVKVVTLVFIVLCSFFGFAITNEVDKLRNELLNRYKKYESDKYLGYKSYKLELSSDGFLRYSKVYTNNKMEYYSVKLNKLLAVDYHGNENNGNLLINCEFASVIFQTHRDPKGNLDSMVNVIVLPLNNIPVEELNFLLRDFDLLSKSFN